MAPLHCARSGEMIMALLTNGAKPASSNFRGCNALIEQVCERRAACVSLPCYLTLREGRS